MRFSKIGSLRFDLTNHHLPKTDLTLRLVLVTGVFKETGSRRFQDIQKVLIDLLTDVGKTCSEEDLTFVTLLLEQHTELCAGIQNIFPYVFRDGRKSYGFYYLYVRLTMYEAEPKVFFQILKVDLKIGWTNPAHVEKMVFQYKGIKIIEDEKVTDSAKHFYIKK